MQVWVERAVVVRCVHNLSVTVRNSTNNQSIPHGTDGTHLGRWVVIAYAAAEHSVHDLHEKTARTVHIYVASVASQN